MYSKKGQCLRSEELEEAQDERVLPFAGDSNRWLLKAGMLVAVQRT